MMFDYPTTIQSPIAARQAHLKAGFSEEQAELMAEKEFQAAVQAGQFRSRFNKSNLIFLIFQSVCLFLAGALLALNLNRKAETEALRAALISTASHAGAPTTP